MFENLDLNDYSDLLCFASIFIAIAASIIAFKTVFENWQLQNMRTFKKRIYNYQGKTQQQIYEILALEMRELNITGYEIHKFSEPYFEKDLSAEYTVYLKKLEV